MKYRLIFFHLALLTALAGLLFGGLQLRDYQTILFLPGTHNALVFDHDGNAYKMPFELQLTDLQVSRYPSGTPKMVTAILLCSHSGVVLPCSVSINHPAQFRHYQIYLERYRLPNHNQPGEIHLKLVRQPAQVFVYVGLSILIVLLCCDFIYAIGKTMTKKLSFSIVALSIFIMLLIMLLNPMMRHVEVPPILQSVWFLPHVIVYILAYTLLTLGFLLSVWCCFKRRYRLKKIGIRCFQAGTALFAIGLILGMIWAKNAWGVFWSWDPKESFALLTLAIDAAYLHFLFFRPTSPKINCVWQSLGFLSLQMCWYGVQILGLGGLHVY